MQQIKAAVADKAKLQASLDEANGTVVQMSQGCHGSRNQEIEKLKAELGKQAELLSAKERDHHSEG